MVLSLTLVSLVAAALLAVMNDVTKGPIAEQNKLKEEGGLKKVILGSADSQEQIKVEQKQNGDYTLYYVTNEAGENLGVAVKTAVMGFSPDLTVMVGFDAEGNIKGYEILKQAETPGLGANVPTWFQDEANHPGSYIIGKNPSKGNFTVSKDGGDVDAITASTITSRAFLKAVKAEYDAAFGANANSGATEKK